MRSTAPKPAWCPWKKKTWAWGMSPNHRPFQSPKELAVHLSLLDLLVQPGATQFLCDLEMSNSGSTRKKGSLPATIEVWTEKKLSVEGTDYIHFTCFTACTMHSMFRALFGVPHLFARELLMNSPHSAVDLLEVKLLPWITPIICTWTSTWAESRHVILSPQSGTGTAVFARPEKPS